MNLLTWIVQWLAPTPTASLNVEDFLTIALTVRLSRKVSFKNRIFKIVHVMSTALMVVMVARIPFACAVKPRRLKMKIICKNA